MSQQVNFGEIRGDQWNEMAKLYTSLTVGVNRRPIAVMLERANELLAFSKATAILDNGCGPGPVMQRLLEEYQVPNSCSLTCADFSEGMITRVKEQKEEKVNKDASSPWQRVETLVQDATNLNKIADSSRSHVTAGWVYFATSDPMKCLNESRRILKEDGVLACSSWQNTQWGDLTNLYVKVRPDKKAMAIPKAWTEVDALKGELEKAGFKDVECHQVKTQLQFQKVDGFVDLMADKMPHMKMLTQDMSKEEMEKFKTLMMEETRNLCPTEPGTLHGTSLVAVGRK
ncbi:hypothetical protein ACLMJK_003850 [Lecanora helva]